VDDAKKERVIKWLQDLMTEAAGLVTELEREDRPGGMPSMWTPIQGISQELQEHVKSCALKDQVWHLKIKYVASDVFARFADQVRKMDGEYISAGRDSEFRIPHRKAR